MEYENTKMEGGNVACMIGGNPLIGEGRGPNRANNCKLVPQTLLGTAPLHA